ncbi:HEAT repeat domain-containing protein [Spirulina major CS-329]|uniref:HEAT repeat domain-containing protein n=1 Tax=Spirulina TaxID=1154 RepID=UPI00232E3B09|nr:MULTISPECIES: HEAT repeat domain-containing protein [Spirulina]MDB9493206.1 HEAT repeat domain-containing protein [Spirulina subsalsa CS-330]MDB9503543.1 HEAT repeat domain-containing protein [Spirulina major CS-329]
MQGVAGFVIGAAIASAVGVGLQRRKLEMLQAAHKTELSTLRKTLEQDYERQLKTATDALNIGQQRQTAALDQVNQEMQQQFAHEQEKAVQAVRSHYETQLAAMTAQHRAELATLRQTLTPTVAPSLADPAKTAAIAIDRTQALSHPDPLYRCHAAQELHTLVLAQPVRAAAEPWLADLACLSQDPEPAVRQSAIAALADVKSDRVIPWLEQALRDPDPRVIQTAAHSLNAFKTYDRQPSQPLPKNAAYTPE